jgi:nitrogen regulatory protein PII
VKGWGRTHEPKDRSPEGGYGFAIRTKLEVVVTDEMASQVVEVIVAAARTGGFGDGKVFVYDVAEVVKIRTGEVGPQALDPSEGGEHGA